MLNRKIPKLRLDLRSKGRSRFILPKYVLSGVPVLSIFALLGITAFILEIPSFSNISQAYAEGSSSGSTSASLIIDNGTIKDTINATLGETNYVSHNVQVKADDIESYNLTISSSGLKGASTISGADNKKGSEMANDTWGFGWDDTSTQNEAITYRTIGTTDNPTSITSGTPATNSIDFTKKLVFAAKFTNAESGHYTASVNLNLVATPSKVIEGLGFGGITEMQDMTVKLCQGVAVGTEGRLIDNRDDSVYWVAKLADENCWMTQNLDLILENITLTPDDTDIAANKTITTRADKEGGDFVFTTPTTSQACNQSSTSSNQEFSLRECADKGWQELDDGYKASGDPRFYEHNGNQVVKDYVYDAHYKLGNYYYWGSATANSLYIGEGQSGVASYSICPKGWQLPRGDTSAVSNTAYWGLTQKYGVSSSLTNGSTDIRLAPLYFYYSGVYTSTPGSSSLNVGGSGAYLTSSATDNALGGTQGTQMLNINSSNVTYGTGGRFSSYQVRCYVKAKTGGTTGGSAIN